MAPGNLVKPLFLGPIDIVGDIHGEIDALRSLLGHLGYADNGGHAENRRLVFLGDLTDRGPDSPAVVNLVSDLLERERAQCILGNHELNILLGQKKHGNAWLHGAEEEVLDESGKPVRQQPADEATRAKALELFRRLPLALEREHLCVVHACWVDSFIDLARQESDVVSLHDRHKAAIEEELNRQSGIDKIDRGLAKQNKNPVKLLTSGPEAKSGEAVLRQWQVAAGRASPLVGHLQRRSALRVRSLLAAPARQRLRRRPCFRRQPPLRHARKRQGDVHRLLGRETVERAVGWERVRSISNAVGSSAAAGEAAHLRRRRNGSPELMTDSTRHHWRERYKFCTGRTPMKSFDSVAAAVSHVVMDLISNKHSYILNIRGPGPDTQPTDLQIVPRHFVYDDGDLGLTLHLPCDPTSNKPEHLAALDLSVFDKRQVGDIPCFEYYCGTDVNLVYRMVMYVLEKLHGYSPETKLTCEVYDEGP